ncbi:hypothetical protein [Vibrio rhodolitus]|uniref:hypothetical protein n=1 Tax=Vibrio rhodolitus TaxID=2231649 RepID=UPI000F4DCD12|nr:hypothetical protein [Vibrio rhodolitus]
MQQPHATAPTLKPLETNASVLVKETVRTIPKRSNALGKNTGSIFRFSVSATPKTDRTTSVNPERLSGYSLARQRVNGLPA